MCPVKGLIYERSCGSASAAEDHSGDRNALGVVELGGNARAVLRGSCEAAVRMSELLALGCPLLTVAVYTCPLLSVLGRIFVKTLPPNGHICLVYSYVCKDSALLCTLKSVIIGFCVSSGSNSEEAVLGVDSVKSSVLAYLHPRDIVSDCEYLIALLLISLGRNEHSEVCLSAGGRESGGYVLYLAVRLLYAEDKHMLCHPALVLALIGRDTKSEALLSEKNVSAVSGVYRPDRIVLGELNYISLFGIYVSL